MRVVMTRIIVGVLMTAVQSMAWEQWTERDLVMPDARAGHSMTSRHGLVYVFGGRNNNKEVSHRPMTFDLNIEFGQIEFTTYDGKEITNCTGQDNDLCDKYPRIQIGEYKNDVWKYDLDRKIACMRNTNASNMTLCDESAADSYWVQLDQSKSMLKYFLHMFHGIFKSRCICDPKWTGEDCSSITCLNNCTYPWGDCTDGVCVCRDIMNPYNNTQVWAKYEGPDCSWITPFASASTRTLSWFLYLVFLSGMAVFIL